MLINTVNLDLEESNTIKEAENSLQLNLLWLLICTLILREAFLLFVGKLLPLMFLPDAAVSS